MSKQLLPTSKPNAPSASSRPENGSLEDSKKTSSSLAAGLAYCSVSAAMVLLNKYALSSFHFSCPNMLLLAQCISSVVIVKFVEALGYWKVQPLRWDIVKV